MASSADASKRTSLTGPRGRSPNHTSTPSNSGPANGNLARTRSVKNAGSPLSAKGAARRPTIAGRDAADPTSEESKAETAALIEDLKTQLHKAESSSEDYQKQLFVLQKRFDDTTNEHTKLEESSHANIDKLEALEKEKSEALRRHRDLQVAFENDKTASMREREEASSREEELNGIVQRLKDSLAQREAKAAEGEGILARSASFRGRSSPGTGPDSPIREQSQNNSKLLLQKDKVIESLRLELAEAQIKLVELENAGGGHVQELEKMLLEARMSNAKLMEDNESYQMLLSEKTLNGDLTKTSLFETQSNHNERSDAPATPSAAHGTSSLEDELKTMDSDSGDEHIKKLETEISNMKDQNKALTLYINKIIGKMLANETFETMYQGTNSPTNESPSRLPAAEKPQSRETRGSKESNSSDGKSSDTAPQVQAAASSLLQRAGSIFGGRQRTRPKPPASSGSEDRSAASPPPATATNAAPASSTPPTAMPPMGPPLTTSSGTHLTAVNQDPNLAPSLPIRRSASGRNGNRLSGMRGHKRSSSDWSARISTMNANLAAGTGPPHSPSSPHSTAGSLMSNANPPPLILEDRENPESESGNGLKSDVTSDSGYGESIEPPGSPRSAAAAALEGKPHPTFTRTDTSQSLDNPRNKGAAAGSSWFSSKQAPEKTQMRPLRLVQEKEADDLEKKKANRTSFMGWFGKGPQDQPPGAHLTGGPPSSLHARTPSSLPMGLGPPAEGHMRSVSSVAQPSTGLGVATDGHTRAASMNPGVALSPPPTHGHSRAVSSGVVNLPIAPLEPGPASEGPKEAP